MDIEQQTAADVQRRVQRLREQFGSFELHETTVENEPEFFEAGVEMATDGWAGDAGAWVTDGSGSALLIRHEDNPDQWGTPGGSHEPGEAFEETARREVREETGIDPTITGVRYACKRTAVLADDPEQRFHMLRVIFAATAERQQPAIGDDDLLDAQWWTEPPDKLVPFVENHVATWDE